LPWNIGQKSQGSTALQFYPFVIVQTHFSELSEFPLKKHDLIADQEIRNDSCEQQCGADIFRVIRFSVDWSSKCRTLSDRGASCPQHTVIPRLDVESLLFDFIRRALIGKYEQEHRRNQWMRRMETG